MVFFFDWQFMEKGGHSMGPNVRTSCLLGVVLALATACQLTQPAFARMAGDAGAAFAAASTTFQYTHEGKISEAYAAASFVIFQSELSGLDSTLPCSKAFPIPRRFSICWTCTGQPCGQ